MTRNKGKTRRVIPKQAIMTVAMMRKLPKRSQGPKKYPAAKLKAAREKSEKMRAARREAEQEQDATGQAGDTEVKD